MHTQKVPQPSIAPDVQPPSDSALSPFLNLSIITQYFPPDYAPTGQLIEELAHQLETQGFQIEIFTSQPGYAFQSWSAPTHESRGRLFIRRSRTANLWPHRIRGKAVNGLLFCLRALFYLLRSARRHDVVIITTAPPFLPIVGYLLHKCFRTRYICLLYDLYPDIAVNLKVIQPQHWLCRFWMAVNRRIWRDAQGLIVLSSTMRDRILAHEPELAAKISVIHNWADPQHIVPLEKHRNWFAWKHELVETFTVLYSGNLGRCHDIETLMGAARLLQDDPIQFVLVGSGARYKILMQTVEQLGLRNFRFLPYQDKADLPYSLTACDLSLVSISPNMEGLVAPSKLYSALASGRPIAAICERHSYLHPIIRDAQCGATFQNGDAQGLAQFIRFLSEHPDQSQKMGHAGRAYMLQHFTPEIIAQQYAAVLGRAEVSDRPCLRPAPHRLQPDSVHQ